MILEYLFIFKYIFFCLFIVLILLSISVFLVYQKPDLEKLSTYECGFNPFSDARSKFEIRFYLIGILFIIFDLEISFLFPWVVAYYNIHILGHYVLLYFIIILTLGFIFEWVKGALDWE